MKEITKMGVMGVLASVFGCASAPAPTPAYVVQAERTVPAEPVASEEPTHDFHGACLEGDDAGRLRLLVQAVQARGRERRTLQSGDVVRSGERFHLRMCVSQRAWVYLFQVDSSGRAEALHSRGGMGEAVEARQMMRVPGGRLDILVDERAGDEHLIVVASDRPVGERDVALAEALTDLHGERAPGAAVVTPRARPADVRPRQRPDMTPGDQGATPPVTTGARPAGDVLTAFHPRGISRRLVIVPAEDEGAEVDETKPTTSAEHVVIWRLDLRHVP